MTEDKNAFGFIQELPEEIKQPYQYICQELASISDKWKLYKGLFSIKDNIDVINNTAPRAFQSLEESLRIDIAMSISRLADPDVSCGYENLSIKMLLIKLPHITGLVDAIAKFKDLSQPIITLRKKHFAHNDLKSILYPKDNPFPGIRSSTIDIIIKSISTILNIIVGHYNNNLEMGFELPDIGGAQDLINWLKKGWDAYEKEQAAFFKLID